MVKKVIEIMGEKVVERMIKNMVEKVAQKIIDEVVEKMNKNEKVVDKMGKK